MDHDKKIAKLVDKLARRICRKAYHPDPDVCGRAIGAEHERVLAMLRDTLDMLSQEAGFDEWFAPVEVVEIPEEEKESVLVVPMRRISRPS